MFSHSSLVLLRRESEQKRGHECVCFVSADLGSGMNTLKSDVLSVVRIVPCISIGQGSNACSYLSLSLGKLYLVVVAIWKWNIIMSLIWSAWNIQ